MAAHARPLRDPRLGGDAAADAGLAGRSALPGLARALAERSRAGGRDAGRGDRGLVGARLQPPRGQPAPLRAGGRGAGWVSARPGAASRAARHRPLHRRRHRLLRLRAAGGRSRRQRPPRAGPRLRRPRSAATARPRLRVEPGPVRPGQRHLHRPPPALPALPAGGRLPVGRHDVRPAPQAVPFRGIVPPAPQRRAQASWWRRSTWTLPMLDDREALDALVADGLAEVAGGVATLPR